MLLSVALVGSYSPFIVVCCAVSIMASSQAEEGGSSLPPLPPLPLEAPAIGSNVSNDSKSIPTKHHSTMIYYVIYPAIYLLGCTTKKSIQSIVYQE